ncbi:MAG: cyclopropane fatty acyl phospholipid synthase [bacterium]|nr:MAG: cyclopropane fatty acyl phospholipid synthase [bacterium]
MGGNVPQRHIGNLLSLADVHVNGDRPWDIRVRDGRFYRRVLSLGALGLGESYMDDWWECPCLDVFFHRVLAAGLQEKITSRDAALDSLKAKLINLQSRARAFKVGDHHYDIGNDLFEGMLDDRMVYSCGYWKGARSLDQAQENKLDLVGRKLDLEPGMRVLDVGCGWGGTAKFLSEHYDVEVTGVTVSREQTRLAREICRDLPVSIQMKDYREVEGNFDRILSIGMFEHVGARNYRTFMRTMRRLLKEDGLFLLHTIGANCATRTINAWTNRYIFPNGHIPSPGQISSAIEGLFVLEDWQSFGADYDKTLMSWYCNFERSWPDLARRYSDRFYRMWKYFLLSSAGAFRARWNQLWQIVLSPRGVRGVYHAPR